MILNLNIVNKCHSLVNLWIKIMSILIFKQELKIIYKIIFTMKKMKIKRR